MTSKHTENGVFRGIQPAPGEGMDICRGRDAPPLSGQFRANIKSLEICRRCKHAKDRFGASCYCTKYGIVIGYSKRDCGGFELEQIRQQENNG